MSEYLSMISVLCFFPIIFLGFYIRYRYHKDKLLRECESYRNQITSLEEQIKRLSAEKDHEIERLAKEAASYRDLPYLLSKENLLFDSNVYQSLSEIETPDIQNRLLRAFTERNHYTFSFFNVHANVKYKEDSARSYTVTLNDCTCPDYTFRKKPCKHMYMLALQFALLQYVDLRGVQEKLHALFVQSGDLERKIRREKKLLKSNEQDFPWLAKMLADYELARGDTDVKYLRQKRPSAPKAADTVRSYTLQNAGLILQNKKLAYQLTFYENCFPWLVLFKNLSVENALWVADLVETRGIIDDSAMLNLIETYLPKDFQGLQ